ncbi:hypothetical protein BDA99DRAFT_499232 [Phascolomyces articulosus]|uniref:GATA-type domain-containing protein n=1 Tax=Phascolomyces articulosus TaxID=60185 RepID=A0AAD5KIB4_9FUNG|nr:hypothetical protein BDA99DRAFT_499232 [Phascolomyces articulosus]
MAPIKLRISSNSKSQFPFQHDTEDELSQTWRVCTKVKDSLENGSRYENLAWRLWFMHNVNSQFKKRNTPRKFEKEKAIASTSTENNALLQKQQQQQQLQLQEEQELQLLYTSTLKQQTELPPVRKTINQRRRASKRIENGTFTTTQKKQKQKQHDQYQNQQQSMPPPNHQQQHDMAPPIVSSNILSEDPHAAPVPSIPHHQEQQQEMVAPSVASTAPASIMLPQHQQDQQTLMNDPSYYQSFVLPQFSSDQDINQTISLQDSEIFGDMLFQINSNNNWMNTNVDVPPETTNDLSSSSTSYTFVNNNSTTPRNTDIWINNNPMMMQPQVQQLHVHQQQQLQQQQQQNDIIKNALYVSDECIAPIPHQTLYNKILSVVPQDKLVSSVERVMEQPSQLQLQLQQQYQQKPVMATPSEGKQAICSNCETTQTPLWRRSANDELLCNACGLYAKLHKAPRPRYFENSPTSGGQDEGTRITCSNCATSTTPLWRRDADGNPLCNACGLYLKLHHSKRPLSMKTDVIKKRQRTGDAGMPKGIRMINHQFNPSSSSISQQDQEQQQNISSSSSSSMNNNEDNNIQSNNSNGFHNYTFQVPSPQ